MKIGVGINQLPLEVEALGESGRLALGTTANPKSTIPLSPALSLGGRGGHAAQHLLSLDVFRGFTIAAMVLVNNPGDWGHIYAPLRHAVWHGWTFTDWIFPFFLFICGVSLCCSRKILNSSRRHGSGSTAFVQSVATTEVATLPYQL